MNQDYDKILKIKKITVSKKEGWGSKFRTTKCRTTDISKFKNYKCQMLQEIQLFDLFNYNLFVFNYLIIFQTSYFFDF